MICSFKTDLLPKKVIGISKLYNSFNVSVSIDWSKITTKSGLVLIDKREFAFFNDNLDFCEKVEPNKNCDIEVWFAKRPFIHKLEGIKKCWVFAIKLLKSLIFELGKPMKRILQFLEWYS